MKLNVNGEIIHSDASTVHDLLRNYDFVEERQNAPEGKPTGVAVAVNDAVVPKEQWPSYRLHENDRIEIVRAIQGG